MGLDPVVLLYKLLLKVKSHGILYVLHGNAERNSCFIRSSVYAVSQYTRISLADNTRTSHFNVMFLIVYRTSLQTEKTVNSPVRKRRLISPPCSHKVYTVPFPIANLKFQFSSLLTLSKYL